MDLKCLPSFAPPPGMYPPYVDCRCDAWVPYEIPADCCCIDCDECRDCWCWPPEECATSEVVETETIGPPEGPLPPPPPWPPPEPPPEPPPAGATPEAFAVYPRNAAGQPDHQVFWQNRLEDGWIYPIIAADDAPSQNGLSPGGCFSGWPFNACRFNAYDSPPRCCIRSHPAIDLNKAPAAAFLGAHVQAVADGVVTFRSTTYYLGTGALVIRHPTRVHEGGPNQVQVVYGEILPLADLTPGTPVTKGEPLGRIQRLAPSWSVPGWQAFYMLDFSVYFGYAANGTLQTSARPYFGHGGVWDYVTPNHGNSFGNTRRDLIDPTLVTLLKNNPEWT